MKSFKLPQKSMRRYCDTLWCLVVKERDNYTCIICGNKKNINAHHLISRKISQFRFNILNGVSLCSYCHHFNYKNSPHISPWIFEDWMKINKPLEYNFWIENRNNLSLIELDYESIYLKLEEEYKKLKGINLMPTLMKRFNIQNSEEDIIQKYISGTFSITMIAKEYFVGKKDISKILIKKGILINHGRRYESKESKRRNLENYRNKLGKKLIQYDKLGNFIGEYSSYGDASEKTGLNRRMIEAVSKGHRNSIKGFIFKPKEINILYNNKV